MSLELWSALLQKIPLVRGKTRIGRWIVRRQQPQRDAVVRSRYGQRFKVPHLSESVAYQIAVNGAHEPQTLRALQRLLPDDGVLLDVGANIGFFSCTLAMQKPRARIIAVEASPSVSQYLRYNLQQNGCGNVELVAQALMDRDGESIAFYEAAPGQFGMGSIAPKQWKQASTISTLTLDRLGAERALPRVHVIKIDIQGAETFAFRGGAQLLQRPDAPAIVFEFDQREESATPGVRPGDSQRLLREHGYRLWTLRDWLAGRAPFDGIVERGFHNLVALKP